MTDGATTPDDTMRWLRVRAALLATSVKMLPFVLLAILWQVLASSGTLTPFQLPRPMIVLDRIWSDAVSGTLLLSAALTLYRALAGFCIAAVLGIAIAFAMTRTYYAQWFFDPVVSVGFPMPKVAFLPVIILWLGIYDTAKISMVVFDAIFPVITATLVGIRGVERELIWSARNLGATDNELTRHTILPAALPSIFTGLQVSLPIALIVTIIAEMLMGGYGLGGAMMQASRFANSPSVFAGILEIGVLGYVLIRLMALIRRRLLIWHPETHNELVF
jgi:ABC-type nitrate/sulfonate/bicarbonate transport system permease component